MPKNGNVPIGLGQLDGCYSLKLNFPRRRRLHGGIIDTQTEIKVMPEKGGKSQ